MHNLRMRKLVDMQGADACDRGDKVKENGYGQEPVHIVPLELSEQSHLIMALHYKMISRHKATSGIVFATLEILIIAIEATSMAFLRKSALTSQGTAKWLALGTAGYAVVALVFREVLKFASMARANALWDAGSIVIVTLVGKFVYGERYTPRQWLGVGFAVAAVLCMIGPEIAPQKV